jgi:ABC-type transporter Mla MlaB component
MLSAKARPELATLTARLREWETAVPDRARRFHAVRRDLEKRIQSALSVWRPWIADEIVERFRMLVERLGGIAEPLAELIRHAEQVAAEVRQLETRAPAGDTDLAAWIQARCRGWLATLVRVGANCDRETDLAGDQKILLDIETQERLDDAAVRELQEAGRVLTALGSDLQAAALRARLPELRRRLYTEGASAAWLDEIKGLIQPLRAIMDRANDPPTELRNVASTLNEIRGWSKLLGEREDEVERLEQRQHFFAVDWDLSQVQDLQAAADALRQHLVARAQELRNEKLAGLEEQTADLFQACGYQPDLEERLAALKERSFDRHHLFRDWLNQFDQVLGFFRATAQTQEGALERRLSAVLARLEGQLQELKSHPLSAEVDRQAAGIEHDLRQLALPTGVEEILHGLRRANAIERQLEQLGRRALHEREELVRLQAELAAQNEALQSAARRVKRERIAIADLAPAIAELSQGAEEGSLEDRRQRAAALVVEIAALEEQLAAQCRERLGFQLRSAEQLRDVLRRCNIEPPAAVLPELAASAPPQAVVQAVLDARRQYQLLLQSVRSLRGDLESRLAQAQVEIAALRLDDLAPGDRQTAEQLLQELAAGDEASARRSSLERLERMAQQVEKSDLFFQRLRQEQSSARERLADLRRRLQEFHDDQLHLFCPELTERIVALVYGVPQRPRQWSAVHYQLDRAAELFGRVEIQARRLAAEELDGAAETLRQRRRETRDPAFRVAITRLLDELESRNDDELPPVTLRLRVLNAAQHRA